MMRTHVFGSVHGLRRRFRRPCLGLSPLVFNAAVGPPVLKFLNLCLCVVVFYCFFPWRWWTTSGTRHPAGWPDSDLELSTLSRLVWIPPITWDIVSQPPVYRCCVSRRCAATPWGSTALAKLGSGASGATPLLRQRPTVVSSDANTQTHRREKICRKSSFKFVCKIETDLLIFATSKARPKKHVT